MEKTIKNKSQVRANYTAPDQTTQTITFESNESVVENLSVAFVKDKSSLLDYGAPKDEILQSILLANESLSEITNIRLEEIIGEGASFKPGSVEIDNVPFPDMDIVAGITLPNSFQPKSGAVVSYVLVIDEQTSATSVALKTKVTFNANEVEDMSEFTPEVVVKITENKLVIDKTSNKTVVISGDTLMYQSVIKNTGKIRNTSVFFKDEIPQGTVFVPKSVRINKALSDEGFDPTVGFEVGALEVGGEIEVTFEVTIT